MGSNFDEMAHDELWDVLGSFVDTFSRDNLYIDILVDKYSFTSIQKSRTREQITHARSSFGVVLRAFTTQWHEFAFQTPAEFAAIQARVEQLGAGEVEGLAEFPSWTCDEVIPQQKPDLETPLDEKLTTIRQLYADLAAIDERIINPIISYASTTQERIFVNNEGCRLRQVIPRTRVFIEPIAKEGEKQDFDYISIGGEQGFELVEEITQEQLQEVAGNSLAMLQAVDAPTGKMPVVLDPDMAGLVAHESFGHGLEADQVLRKRSYLESLLGQQVASQVANISDAPSEPGQLGTFFFDDEGIKAGKNFLVEDGVLTHFIYGRRSASMLEATPQGNGRRESFLCRVNDRMTNTYFEPGESTTEELFQGVDRGVFLEHGYFGMEDPLGGGIQCTSKKGWLIEDGEKTQLLGPVTLSGRVLDLLQSIDVVTKAPFTLHAGTCGKGSEDYVPVTSGGPALRAMDAMVGPG
jgi:TldD protein